MIILSEQYGYNNKSSIENLDEFKAILDKKSYNKSIQQGDNKAYCYKIDYLGDEKDNYHFQTSYFVGVDWVIDKKLPIYVYPKLDENQEIDYLNILFEILKEPENYNHLNELYKIDFERMNIPINQQQDLLTPLLLVQYLTILKKIVKKGLKKSYYPITKKLNSKIKGKILISKTIKENTFKNNKLKKICHYEKFGINTIENKILKKALIFCIQAIQNLKGIDISPIAKMIHYILPSFADVDDYIELNSIKHFNINVFYKEYSLGLEFAKLILQRYGFNISQASSNVITSPPFWIDMSKLFELYVYSKLKERFTNLNEVVYHKKFNQLEPDFIVKTTDGVVKMVVDAKYKPRYENNNINKEDARQISGYARLKKVYDFLGVQEDQIIDCLVIYSSQNSGRKDFIGKNFNIEEDKHYMKFYKIGIELPIKAALIKQKE